MCLGFYYLTEKSCTVNGKRQLYRYSLIHALLTMQYSTYIQETVLCHILSKMIVIIGYLKILIIGVSPNKKKSPT